MVAGLAVAIPAAVLTFVAALAILLVMHGSGSSVTGLLLDFVYGVARSEHPDHLLAVAVRAAAQTIAIVCCAPVLCAALIGQIAQVRRPVAYAILSAALTVLLPMAAVNASASFDALSWSIVLGPLLAIGAVAGLCYGAIVAPPEIGHHSSVRDSLGRPASTHSKSPPASTSS